MPKGKGFKHAFQAGIVKDLNRLPQEGFFSTLDELIQNAPFERAPPDQWDSYLQPGKLIEREGVKFPLKKEEREYSGLNHLFQALKEDSPRRNDLLMLMGADPDSLTRDQLAHYLYGQRPTFRTRLGRPDSYSLNYPRPEEKADPQSSISKLIELIERGFKPFDIFPSKFEAYINRAPVNESGGLKYSPEKGYEESITEVRPLETYPNHFTPSTISHSRSTLRPAALDPDQPLTYTEWAEPPPPKLVHLIEEIQSDRHQDPNDPVRQNLDLRDFLTEPELEEWNELSASESRGPQVQSGVSRLAQLARSRMPKRGIRTPEQTKRMLELSRILDENNIPIGDMSKEQWDYFKGIQREYEQLRDAVPAAPFKDDYVSLEMRKQLLDAVNQDADYLALARGMDQIERYPGLSDQQAAGMRRAYDERYPSELRKLAKRYGVENLTSARMEVPISSTRVVRPQTLDEFEAADVPDFMEGALDVQAYDSIGQLANELHTIIQNHQNGPHPPASRALRRVRELTEALQDPDLALGQTDFNLYHSELDRYMRQLDSIWKNYSRFNTTENQVQEFPAIELTPELKALIKKVGVPLWSLAGLGLGLPEDEEPQGLAKGGKVKSGFKDAAERQARYEENKLPQLGFFSTLDELIRQAPFEQAPVDQWRSYLQPGKLIEREGVKFPLKKEELEYSRLFDTLRPLGAGALPRSEVLRALHLGRPSINTTLQKDWSSFISEDGSPLLIGEAVLSARQKARDQLGERIGMGPAQFQQYSHQPAPYEESLTDSYDFGTFNNHFNPGTISHSRSTTHKTDNDKLVRLIEEIQSDRHSAAAEKVTRPADEVMAPGEEWTPTKRRGYRTPEQEELLQQLIERSEGRGIGWEGIRPIQQTPPDAPFKDPADYGTLEMKKQLLDAVNQDADYLALTRGQDQIERYGFDQDSDRDQEAAGMEYIYDQIYPSALAKLMKRYGVEGLTTVEVPLQSSRLEIPTRVQDAGFADMADYFTSSLDDGDYQPVGELAIDLLDDIGEQNPMFQQAEIHQQAIENLIDRLENRPSERLQEKLQNHFDSLADIWHEIRKVKSRRTPKRFPALELTPELRELIKKVGVPLWSLGGLGLGFDQLAPDEPAPVGLAKGGKAERERKGTLAYLKSITKSLANALPFAEGNYADELDRKMKLPIAGFATQVYGQKSPEAVPELMSGKPGIIDDTISLPAYFDMTADARLTPELSARAADRAEELQRRIYEELGIESDPEGIFENFLDSLGIMAGQVPVGGLPGLAKKANLAKTVLGSPLEFFAPTIDPKLANYLGGAGFGATLSPLVSAVAQLIQSQENTSWDPEGVGPAAQVAYARGGKV